MASSRWKRFSFFERHTLSLPSEVLEDLLPLGSDDRGGTRLRQRSSQDSAEGAASDVVDDESNSVSLVVTTASLPLTSKPKPEINTSASTVTSTGNEPEESKSSAVTGVVSNELDALTAMWSSLTACTLPIFPNNDERHTALLQLPSQGQQHQHPSGKPAIVSPTFSSSASLDGLVLVFVTSQDTELVHCFDITVRCNPPAVPGSGGDLEDMDGWRGYFAPFSAVMTSNAPVGSIRSLQDHQHLAASASSDALSSKRVVGLAACRPPVAHTPNATNTSTGVGEVTQSHRPIHVACVSKNHVLVWEDPHLYLSVRRPLTTPRPTSEMKLYTTQSPWNTSADGHCLVVDICPGIVAVGTDTGVVVVYLYQKSTLRPYLRIPPPPPVSSGMQVVSVKLSKGSATTESRASIFVAYRQVTAADDHNAPIAGTTSTTTAGQQQSQSSGGGGGGAGVCCYEMPLFGTATVTLSAPSARHDLDGRHVASRSLVDAHEHPIHGMQLTVARPDGLYKYSKTERTGVIPIDGNKLVICLIPPPIPGDTKRQINLDFHHQQQVAASGAYYSLVASTDAKSGRDAVDIYDSINKLVAFHLLLSPGHKAVRAAGVATFPITTATASNTSSNDGSNRQGGRSSAIVLTSGGSIVTLTEKLTDEKISLLVQKNLYSAAIVVAYADPSYEAESITNLYRQYAEHLYRKAEFAGAIDQYCNTIGSLESSHVIFRFLDAPKIPLLVKYLEKLRERDHATPVHNELLRTCYLKLNDTESADAIAASGSSSVDKNSLASILPNLANNPKDALATVCSLDAKQAAEILVIHGASLARVLPRETAGVVLALCLGTYSPKALADAAAVDAASLRRLIEANADEKERTHEPYPAHLFASAFVENPKMLRLILAHCNRSKCFLTPSLRRTLLELTLDEWNQAKRMGDADTEKLRHKEAIAALTDSHCRDIGDYDALVIVQMAGFSDGELLLFERLQMTPMLLQRYANDGSEKSRRQMLAMCQTDPEILADVLGHFVDIASEKLKETSERDEDTSEYSDADDILEDIREALSLARLQGVLPPVRVARILAGEGTGQFSAEGAATNTTRRRTVPLSVALDYVGTILEESRKEITRLTSEVEEYNQLCNSMESEIDTLLRASHTLPPASGDNNTSQSQPLRLNIDELYAKVRTEEDDRMSEVSEQPREAFWRDMNQSEDTFDTIARFFAKGVIS